MSIKRYSNSTIISINDQNEVYKDLLSRRNIKNVNIYKMRNLVLDETSNNINFILKEEIWKDGDKLYKLSKKHYNSIEFWWVIGLFNQKPTDSDYKAGDLVLIPYPLNEFMEFIGAL